MEPFEKYQVEEFNFAERKAVIIYPNCEPVGKMVLKTEYLGAFPSFDYAMLDRGYYGLYRSRQEEVQDNRLHRVCRNMDARIKEHFQEEL